MPSLAEQAKARGKQEEKERRMAVELEAAIFELESLKKSHQALGEKLKAELALTQAKYVCVMCVACFTVYFESVVQTGSHSYCHV